MRPSNNSNETDKRQRRQETVTLLDGGTGSELRRRGVMLTDAVWSAAANVAHVDLLTAIHRDYIDAGADVITANTFAASRFVLEPAGLGDRFEAISRAAIDAARRACDAAPADRHVLLAASLSCYPPLNDPARYPDRDLELACYRESVRIFEDAGAELILVEMIQDTAHGSLVCEAAAESALPFWLGLSCRQEATSGRLVGFDRSDAGLAETLESLIAYAPAAVCVMHSPVDVVDAALEAIRDRWHGRTGAWPEIPYEEDPELGSPPRSDANAAAESPAESSPAGLARCAESWLDAGATIIGGCCGTTPAHIAALRRLIDTRNGQFLSSIADRAD